jgi:hypothetical protein
MLDTFLSWGGHSSSPGGGHSDQEGENTPVCLTSKVQVYGQLILWSYGATV